MILPSQLHLAQPEPIEQWGYRLLVAGMLGACVCLSAKRNQKETASLSIGIKYLTGLGFFALWYYQAKTLPFFEGQKWLQGTLWLSLFIMAAQWNLKTMKMLSLILLCGLVADKLSMAIFTEASLVGAMPEIVYHLPYTAGETFAFQNGLTPLVDFFSMYSRLFPWVIGPIIPKGDVFWFSVSMAILTGIIFISMFVGILARLHKPSLALACVLSVLGFSSIPMGESGPDRYFLLNYFATMPMRYFFPTLIFLFLSTKRERWIFPTMVLGWIHSLEAGLACSLGMIFFGISEKKLGDRKLLGVLALSPLVAIVFYTFATSMRSGQMPQISEAFTTMKIFPSLGIFMLPITDIGLNVIILSTFIAACFVGGVSSFLGGSGLMMFYYYIGRSHPQVLMSLFPWFVLALVSIGIKKRNVLVWSVLGFVLIVGLGNLFPLKSPSQYARLTTRTQQSTIDQKAQFLKKVSQSTGHSKMFIGFPYSHAVAMRAGIKNLFPYAEQSGAVFLAAQVSDLGKRVAQAGFPPMVGTFIPEIETMISTLGYKKAKDLSTIEGVWIK